MSLDVDTPGANLGISRRDLIKRGAIVGGTVMWVAPAVQSFTSPAGAAVASAACDCTLHINGNFGSGNFSATCVINPAVPGAQQRCNCDCCCEANGAGCDQCNSPNRGCDNLPQFTTDYCCTCNSGPCPNFAPFNTAC